MNSPSIQHIESNQAEPGQSQGSADACAAGAAPPSPVLVTRGESNSGDETTGNQTALIDWLAFTVHPGKGIDWLWMRDCLKHVFEISPEAWTGTNKKWSGYTHRVDLIHPGQRGESINLGLVAYGGDRQKGTIHASLNAQACARITDWQQVMDWGESVGANITRVDCAHDDFDGKILTVEKAMQWYADGFFTTNGRPPAAELIHNMDSSKGNTFYVGKRIHGKLLRIYEKGKKEGDSNSPWVRAEVEFHNKSRVIPWDIVINPGHYLAGAYPCLSYLSTEQSRIKTITKLADITYDSMVKWLNTAAGKSLNAMLLVEDDVNSILEKVRRDGFPKRLEPYIHTLEKRQKYESVSHSS